MRSKICKLTLSAAVPPVSESTEDVVVPPNVVVFPTGGCWNKFANATDICGPGAIQVTSDEGTIEMFVGASCNCGSGSGSIYGLECRERCSKVTQREDSDKCAALNLMCYIDEEAGEPVCGCENGLSSDKQPDGSVLCYDRNLCESCLHKCHKTSKCNRDKSFYTCEPCNEEMGYRGAGGMQCNNINECLEKTHQCDPANAVCVDRDPIYDDSLKYICNCKEGWRQDRTAGFVNKPCVDEDECVLETHKCDSNSYCNNTQGSYICTCKKGYRKLPGQIYNCTDIDECLEGHSCHAFAECKNTPGSYECHCKEGYLGDGLKECKPDKEVQCKKCDAYSTDCALNSAGTVYSCQCKDGYRPIQGNPNMCVDIDECMEPSMNNCDKPSRATCENKPGTYECTCKDRYEGDGVTCTPIDPCKRDDPCGYVSNAVCVAVDQDTTTCVCKPSYVRQLRDVHNASAPCYDETSFMVVNCTACDITQTCEKEVQGPYFKCVCLPGFVQNALGICENYNECRNPADNDCDENARCTDRNPVVDGKRYECTCITGYTGEGTKGKCEDIVECNTTNICNPDSEVCENNVGSFRCNCKLGYGRLTRDSPCANLDECSLNLHNCPMHSICHDEDPGFKCECMKGFRPIVTDGKLTCQNIDECKEGIINRGGLNTSACDRTFGVCTDSVGSYICTCKSGSVMNRNGYNCDDIDECATDQHTCTANLEICANKPGYFECHCVEGLERDNSTGICVDIDECSTNQYRCNPNSECKNKYRGYTCVCSQGYVKTPTSSISKPTCEKEDMCAKYADLCTPGVCKHTDDDPFFDCECTSATLKIQSEKCKGCSRCVWPDYCDQDIPCPRQSTCEGGRCQCAVGYRWIEPSQPLSLDSMQNRKECIPINPCTEKKVCSPPFTCNYQGPGNYSCDCDQGYEKFYGECIDIDECALGLVTCPKNSKCENILGSYKCSCDDGYAARKGSPLHSPVCEDINECDTGTHNCTVQYALCFNEVGSFRCDCPLGFDRQAPVYEICTDIDECGKNIDNCHEDAMCLNTNGSFSCECNTGYHGNGEKCWDINECEDWSHKCTVNQTCENLPGTYNCSCKPGFELTAKGCLDINECLNEQNHNCTALGGDVRKRCVNLVGSFVCVCPEGYTEKNNACVDVNECTLAVYPCPTGLGDKCENTNGSFACTCKNGFRKPKSSSDHLKPCEDIDECKEGVTKDGNVEKACGPSTNCTNTLGGYTCECHTYHQGDAYSKEGCKVSDLCGLTNKCSNITEDCYDVNGAVDCKCKQFYLRNPGGICQPNPCRLNNGGCGDKAECIPQPKAENLTAVCHCPEAHELDKDNNCVPKNFCQCDRKACKSKCSSVLPKGTPCYSSKVCSASNMMCVELTNNYTCVCEQGYKLSENKTACININECKEGINGNPEDIACKNKTIRCIDQVPGWSCDCPRGMILKYTSECGNDVDCSRENFCKDIPHSRCEKFEDGKNYCQCVPGFEGNATVEDPCNKIDYCRNNTAETPLCEENENCTSLLLSHHCKCAVGFARNMTTGKCDDIDECVEGCAFCKPTFKCRNTVGTYVCECAPGMLHNTTTDRCEYVNECLIGMNDCDNTTEVCVDQILGYKCECKEPEYAREGGKGACLPIDMCAAKLFKCPHLSYCTPLYPGYNCTCMSGMEPTEVDPVTKIVTKCDDIDECKIDPCPKVSNCSNMVGTYKCDCHEGYLQWGMQACLVNRENCTQCHKDAECLVNVQNDNSVYNCTCRPGYTGDGRKDCINIDECESEPCHPKAECTDTTGSFYCECNEPYTGDGINNCTRKDLCKEFNDCPKNAKCVPVEGDEKVNGYWVDCECPAGHKFNPVTRECDDIDECEQKPCAKVPVGITCNNTQGSFVCICPFGYDLMDDKLSCYDIDECLEHGKELCLHNNGVCVNKEGTFECECKDGFRHVDAEKQICKNIDECNENLDNCERNSTSCLDNHGSFTCLCKPGLRHIPNNATACEDINECEEGIHSCKTPQELCHNLVGSHACNCSNGYINKTETGECVPADQCDTECGTNAWCILKPDPTDPSKKIPTCVCQDGYYGVDPSKFCDPVVDCNNGTECPSNSHCLEIQARNSSERGRYECVCDEGFKKLGSQCVDIIECEEKDICGPNAICENLVPGYKCVCNPESVNIGTGANNVTCEEKTCANSGTQCNENAQCIDKDGGITCKCNEGYRGHGYGENGCTPISMCKEYPPCSQYADCFDTPFPYKCVCKSGFNGNGTHCYDNDECKNEASPPCDKNALCVNTQGSFTCRCNQGYTGSGLPDQCVDIDECSSNVDNCDDKTTICNNQEPGYLCDCKRGYERLEGGENTTCTDINECKDPKVCGIHNCNNLAGDYECICLSGYEPLNDQKTCIDINECLDSDPCLPTQDCHNNEGSYSCECKTGYTGNETYCQPLDLCASDETNNCDKESTTCEMMFEQQIFRCNCKTGFKPQDGQTQYSHCVDINECTEGEPDQYYDIMTEECNNTIGSYEKYCMEGLEYVQKDGKEVCEDINECALDPAYQENLDKLAELQKAGGEIPPWKDWMIPPKSTTSPFGICYEKAIANGKWHNANSDVLPWCINNLFNPNGINKIREWQGWNCSCAPSDAEEQQRFGDNLLVTCQTTDPCALKQCSSLGEGWICAQTSLTDALCICDSEKGYKERVNEKAAYCSKVECEANEVQPTSITNLTQRVLVRCENSVWVAPIGYNLVRDPLSKKPVAVEDINECLRDNACCDSKAAQCNPDPDATENQCQQICVNTPGSFDCMCLSQQGIDDSFLAKDPMTCKCTVRCSRNPHWYMKCLGDRVECDYSLLQTLVTNSNITGKVCSRIKDKDSTMMKEFNTAMDYVTYICRTRDGKTERPRQCAFTPTAVTDIRELPSFNYEGPCAQSAYEAASIMCPTKKSDGIVKRDEAYCPYLMTDLDAYKNMIDADMPLVSGAPASRLKCLENELTIGSEWYEQDNGFIIF